MFSGLYSPVLLYCTPYRVQYTHITRCTVTVPCRSTVRTGRHRGGVVTPESPSATQNRPNGAQLQIAVQSECQSKEGCRSTVHGTVQCRTLYGTGCTHRTVSCVLYIRYVYCTVLCCACVRRRLEQCTVLQYVYRSCAHEQYTRTVRTVQYTVHTVHRTATQLPKQNPPGIDVPARQSGSGLLDTTIHHHQHDAAAALLVSPGFVVARGRVFSGESAGEL